MLTVKVTIVGDEEANQKLVKFARGIKDWSTTMSAIGKEVVRYTSGEVFASQGAAIGERWKALDKKYALYKATGHTTANSSRWPKKRRAAKLYPGRGILVRTGKMQRGFKADVTMNSATIYNTDPKFAYHQSNQPRTKIPRRVMLKASPAVRSMVAVIINNDLGKKFAEAGF